MKWSKFGSNKKVDLSHGKLGINRNSWRWAHCHHKLVTLMLVSMAANKCILCSVLIVVCFGALYELGPECSHFCYTSSTEGMYRVTRPAVGEALRCLIHHLILSLLLLTK